MSVNNKEDFLCELSVWAIKQKKNTGDNFPEQLIKDYVLWKWSTRHGKYEKCRYWSEDALESKNRGEEIELRHEHIIPRKVVANMLMKAFTKKVVTKRKIKQFLSTFCIGCVLTEKEDAAIPNSLVSQMPDDWDEKDIWCRYREAFREDGIVIWEASWESKRLVKKGKVLTV